MHKDWFHVSDNSINALKLVIEIKYFSDVKSYNRGSTVYRKRSESQASISSKSSFSSSVASSSKTRKSSPKLLPLTPVLSESEKSHPLEGEVFAGTSKQNPYPERERSRTQEVTENMATSERTTLLSDIKKGTALRKTGTFSNKHPRV